MVSLRKSRRAFTLVELMVALVVGGLLMAGLVALSGAVQRSFAGSKEVTEIQANLRFAMMKMTEDISRTGLMYGATTENPNPAEPPCHLLGQAPEGGWSPTGKWHAMEFTGSADQPVLTLRGNFLSTRDYSFIFLSADTGQVICHDQTLYSPPGMGAKCCNTNPMDPATYINSCCNVGAYQRVFRTLSDCEYILPFGDGATFEQVFMPGQLLKMEAQKGEYTYHRVSGNNAGALTFTFTPAADIATVAQGTGTRVNPVVTIQYAVLEDINIAGRYVLLRRHVFPDGTVQEAELADYLLPPSADLQQSGFSVEVIFDSDPNRSQHGECRKPWEPKLPEDAASVNYFTPIQNVAAQDLIFARAIRITMRGRGEREDPHFILSDYGVDPTLYDFGHDLDGNTANGLAHVRLHRSIIYPGNLGLNLTM